MRNTPCGYMTGLEWRMINEVDKQMALHAVIYTKPNCPKCRMTMMRLDLPIEHHDATPADFERFKEQGYRSMPIVQIVKDGKVIDEWSDMRPDKIKEWSE